MHRTLLNKISSKKIFQRHNTISPLDAKEGNRSYSNIKLGALPLVLCTHPERSLLGACLQLNMESQEKQHLCSI
jgi:hypothetical protein